MTSLPIAAETFGDLLKYVRRRAQLTQRELAIAVGYTEAHICRLEKNERLPDVTTVAALFIPALYLEDEPELMEKLLKLAAEARRGPHLSSVKINQITIEQQVEQEIGALEDIPASLAYDIPRPSVVKRVSATLERDRCVVLTGMPGLGKTTLAATLARHHQPGIVFWHTFTRGVNTSVEAIVRQLALFFLAHGQAQVRPLIERRPDDPLMPLDQQIMLLRAALMRQPALLCFDDAHLLIESEPGLQPGLQPSLQLSVSLLRHLITTTSASLLITSRQDLPLPGTHIILGGLEPEEARCLVQRLGLNLDSGMVDRLLDRTGRSPMLLRLAAGQVLETQMGARELIEHIETQPQVSSYLLNGLLNDLSPSARWLVTLMSIFRHPLDLYDETLADLIRKSDQPCCLDEALAELQNKHLIDNPRFAALHPLVGDHLYATLAADAARKKRFHRLAAKWSERAIGEEVEAAHHWVLAGGIEQAAEVIGNISEVLFERGQSQAAVQVVDEALAHMPRKGSDTTHLRCRLLSTRGDLLRGTSRAAEAEASYREALSLAQDLPILRAQIVRNVATILMQRGQPAEGLHLLQSARAALAPSDTIWLARLASIECRAHLTLSHYDEAEKIAGYALELSGQFADYMPQLADDVRARAERTLGWASYTRHPQGAESLVHLRRALDCARRAGLRVNVNSILSNIATVLMEQGKLEQAMQTYQEAIHSFESMGDMYGKAGILHNLGMLHYQRQDPEMALAYFKEASDLERIVGDSEGLLSTEAARASISITLNKVTEARLILDRALAEDKGSTDVWTMGTFLCVLVEVLLLQGELGAARQAAQRALALPGIQENARMNAWAQSGLALVHMTSGELDAAQDIIASPPAQDLGLELTTRWRLVQIAVYVSRSDLAHAQLIYQSLIQAAGHSQFSDTIPTAEKMIANPALPVRDLLRLILIQKP